MATFVPQSFQAPITAYLPYPILSSIEDPTLEQLHYAACIWDMIAINSGLEYAFVGSIVARLRANDDNAFETNTIEILVRPATLANGAKQLVELRVRHQRYLGFTPTNQLVVIIEGNKGIALQFFANRDGCYPQHFIPPNNSAMYTGEYAGLHPTFNYIYLYGINPSVNRYLPCIRCRWLLVQRLFRFDPDSQDANKIDQNIHDITTLKYSSNVPKRMGIAFLPRPWKCFYLNTDDGEFSLAIIVSHLRLSKMRNGSG